MLTQDHRRSVTASLRLACLTVLTLLLAAGGIVFSDTGSVAAGMTISSIDPGTVDRGDEVTVAATGLGAENVAVTVGAARATVLRATGHEVVFRVPDDAPFGTVPVILTNPGGRTVSGELTVRWDGSVSIVVDDGRVASATIGRAGGAITAGDVVLDVPADALATDVEITVTPIVAMPDAPFEDAFVAGVRLEPEGLHFLRSVTVRTASPGVPVLTAHGTSNGSDISLIPHDVHADEIAIDMTHFTIVAVWEARQEIVRITTERLLSRGEDLALQRLALARAEFGDDLDQIGPAAKEAMMTWFEDVVRGLEAVDAEPAFFEIALSDWSAWVANLQRFGLDDDFETEQRFLLRLVEEITAGMARRLLANCDGTDPATSLRPIARVGVAMQILDIDISGTLEQPDDLTSRFLPADVIAACASIRITDVSHPDPLAKGIENPVSVSAVLESWNGAPRSDLTMRFKRFELAGDALALVDTSDEVGTWNTTVQPSTSPDETNFVLDLEVTLPTEDLELLITGGEFQQRVPTRDRLELLVRRPGEVVYSDSIDSIEPGEQIELGVRLAGPDLDAQTVEYSFVGRGGNLSAASGVTNPIGQSTFTFTAPNDGGQIVISAEEQHAGDTWVDTLSFNVTDPLIVTVSPAQRTLQPGQTVQFFAQVDGSAATGDVVWNATGGSISPTGLYIAGDEPGNYSVTATSVDDPDAVGIAIVEIAAEEVIAIGTWVGEATDSRFPNAVHPYSPVRVFVYQLADRYRVGFGFGWREDLGRAAQTMTYMADLDGNVLSGVDATYGRFTFTASIEGDQMTGVARYTVPDSINPNCPAQGCDWDFVVTRLP